MNCGIMSAERRDDLGNRLPAAPTEDQEEYGERLAGFTESFLHGDPSVSNKYEYISFRSPRSGNPVPSHNCWDIVPARGAFGSGPEPGRSARH